MKPSEDLRMIADALEPLRGFVIASGEIENGTDTSVSAGLVIDGIREDADEVAQLEAALKEIADWNNYDAGGDPLPYAKGDQSNWHPAKVAEEALGGE